MTRRLRIGIFAGGRSAEHEVSIASAESILREIDRDRYEPFLIYIDAAGGWHLPSGPAPELGPAGSLAHLLGAETIPEHSLRLGSGAAKLPAVTAPPAAVQARAAVRTLADAIDVAFLAVHGPFGEDGTLQGFLELAGIPYTGAGVLASALAMDKVVFKDLMRGHGLPVLDYTSFSRRAWRSTPQQVVDDIVTRLGFRAVVKPARLGSSVGMTLAHDRDELAGALEKAFRWDTKVIVEAYLAGAREFECGVLGNEEPVVFEPGEVVSHHELYDYEAKYVPGLADVLPRAELDPDLSARLRELALAAYRAVDARGMARVDFLAVPDAAYLSEMNTIPGFTTTSMFPKQAELAGIGFGDLVGRLIELALEEPVE
ncbi:MAG: D-alanine--D-alanine ligase family protein [Candidatus Limnocylindria bacterium]